MRSIYLIQSLDNGFYKIGIAKNPKKRIKQLQTGNPETLKLIKTFESEYASIIEKTLHRRFSVYKLSGEWFNLDSSFESEFYNLCEKTENRYKFIKDNSTM